MSDIDFLRTRLTEEGFSVLNGAQNHGTAALPVEVWVRENPYSLVPIPVRGEQEDDYSWNSRIAVANSAFETELQQSNALPTVDVPFTPAFTAPQPMGAQNETGDSNFVEDNSAPTGFYGGEQIDPSEYVAPQYDSEELEEEEIHQVDDAFDPSNYYSADTPEIRALSERVAQERRQREEQEAQRKAAEEESARLEREREEKEKAAKESAAEKENASQLVVPSSHVSGLSERAALLKIRLSLIATLKDIDARLDSLGSDQ